MNRGFSVYIDGIRAAAALVVLLSHFAYPRFTDGRYIWIRDLYLGSDAVVIFFVLSGFVITYCAKTKETALGSFAFARASRFLSVAIPAVLIGFALDNLGASMFPEFYAGQFYNPLAFWEQLAFGLTFANEWTGLATRLGTNGPYWSLSYEAAYYALFAVFFFLSGAVRWLLIAAMCVLFGVNVLLLMPCWLMGVYLYWRIGTSGLVAKPLAVVMAVLPPVIYIALLMSDVRADLTDFMRGFLSPAQYHGLRFSDAPVWDFMLACLTVIHLLGVHALCKADGVETGSARIVRYLASCSFTIYLFHYPLLQFLKPWLASFADLPASDLILLGATLVICLGLAAVFERTLKQQRQFVRRLFLAGPALSR
ncbi:acyltransferase [Yoonia sp. SS1-5]|uniref:Acyltransferase family protein n=1 Tax=Yoonia rhodophyticola TaxID=3137370 RepID=A0AAN0M707_9RHOB